MSRGAWVLTGLVVLALLTTSHIVTSYLSARNEAIKVCVENGGEWVDTTPDSTNPDMGCMRPEKK